MPQTILTSQSTAADPRAAAAELAAGIRQPDTALVLFFCSSRYDLDALADALNREFAGVPVIGCTTAGEIGPDGCREGGLTGASFPAADWRFASGRIDGLGAFAPHVGQRLAADLVAKLEPGGDGGRDQRRFAMTFIDGLSLREEPLARAFQDGLGVVPLVGGSAGDDLAFGRTSVFHEGRFRSDCAVLCVARTRCPFRTFKSQHFVRTDQRLVITEADPARRVVRGINGRTAALEYARLIGADHTELSHDSFSGSPVVVLIDGADYVRSIRSANEDGSLTLFCAIEEGVVLRTARSVDLVENLERTFADLRRELGPPQFCLACDCILRSLEAARTGVRDDIARIFGENHAVGFSTYGEQFRGVHVNQTLTGIAVGMPGGDEEASS